MWRVPFRLSQWLKDAPGRRKRVEQIERALVAVPGRERPRDPEVAKYLRERGAPEELLGSEHEQNS